MFIAWHSPRPHVNKHVFGQRIRQGIVLTTTALCRGLARFTTTALCWGLVCFTITSLYRGQRFWATMAKYYCFQWPHVIGTLLTLADQKCTNQSNCIKNLIMSMCWLSTNQKTAIIIVSHTCSGVYNHYTSVIRRMVENSLPGISSGQWWWKGLMVLAGQCWENICDIGPPIIQHWLGTSLVIVSRLKPQQIQDHNAMLF